MNSKCLGILLLNLRTQSIICSLLFEYSYHELWMNYSGASNLLMRNTTVQNEIHLKESMKILDRMPDMKLCSLQFLKYSMSSLLHEISLQVCSLLHMHNRRIKCLLRFHMEVLKWGIIFIRRNPSFLLSKHSKFLKFWSLITLKNRPLTSKVDKWHNMCLQYEEHPHHAQDI